MDQEFKTLSDIKELIYSVLERYKSYLIFVYLFGSAARDNMSHLSDIDIAIFLSKGDKKSYFDIKLSLYADLCRALKRNDIDVIVLNITNNIILLDEIIREGIVLFDKDRDLREEFEHKILHQAIDFKEQRVALMGI